MADLPIQTEDVDHSVQFKQRLGIVLCGFYALVYASFVGISIYDVSLMDTVMPFGLNLATFYGLGLIVFALTLAMVYSRACAISERNASAQAAAATTAAKELVDA